MKLLSLIKVASAKSGLFYLWDVLCERPPDHKARTDSRQMLKGEEKETLKTTRENHEFTKVGNNSEKETMEVQNNEKTVR